jgi:hypothetical protein
MEACFVEKVKQVIAVAPSIQEINFTSLVKMKLL